MNEIEKREVEKRLAQITDVLSWLDHRIATQIEHQLKQRFDQEREYWRLTVTDLIAEERERVTTYIAEQRRELLNVVKQITKEDHEQMVTTVNAIIEQLFDRLSAELASELAAKLTAEIKKIGRA